MAKSYGTTTCPVARTLEVIGERWTMLVIRDLLYGAKRFQDLQDSLEGVAPNVLSGRLKTLEEHGLVQREFYSQHPPRAAYALTKAGRDLAPTLRSLAVWGMRHFGGSTQVVHQECGHPIELQSYCPHCEKTIPSEAVVVKRPERRGAAPAAPARSRRRSG